MAETSPTQRSRRAAPRHHTRDARLLQELREALPRLVRERPEIVAEIQIRLRDVFVCKDDLRAAIDAFNRRTDELHAEMLAGFKALQAEMDRRFEAMERRFEAMDRRFEAMQAEMDRRFEAMERRFEAMDRRFEAMERRFEAMDRRFEAMDRRFEAMQAEMDRRFAEMTEALRELRHEVGKLSASIGFGLEDVARVTLPAFLERVAGVRVEDFERRFFTVDGTEVEVNLFGQGMRGGKQVAVAVEVKSRIYRRDVNLFLMAVEKIRSLVSEELLPVMFAFLVHPSAEEVAKQEGVLLVSAYQAGGSKWRA